MALSGDGANEYHRLPAFIKVFSQFTNMEEMRIPPEFVALHGENLPFHCRLVMPIGTGWSVRLLKIASGCHLCVGWPEFVRDNLIKHGDFLTFTLVDFGQFHVKRFRMGTSCPPRSDVDRKEAFLHIFYVFNLYIVLQSNHFHIRLTAMSFLVVGEDDLSSSYSLDIDTSDDYEPSDTNNTTTDEETYVDDSREVENDAHPTFVVTMKSSEMSRTFEIPYGFWKRHISMDRLSRPMYFLVNGDTWRMTLDHNENKIWVKHGWRRFREKNKLVEGVRLHCTLVDSNDVQFYVWFERP